VPLFRNLWKPLIMNQIIWNLLVYCSKTTTCIVVVLGTEQWLFNNTVNVNVLLVLILGVQGSLIMQFGGSFLLAGVLPSCQSMWWTRRQRKGTLLLGSRN
jgi:hypothetical protein